MNNSLMDAVEWLIKFYDLYGSITDNLMNELDDAYRLEQDGSSLHTAELELMSAQVNDQV